MKKRCLIFLFVIISIIISCKQINTVFTEPQPVNVSNLDKIPKHLQGAYLSLTDSTILKIEPYLIEKIYEGYDTIPSNQLSNNFRMINDTLFNLETNEKNIFRKEKNQIIIHLYFIDTLFSINSDHILRKLKDKYFLNCRYNQEYWEVKKMQTSKGILIISSIYTKEDVAKETTDTIEENELPHKLTMTKKEFKEFVKNQGFNTTEEFVKLK